MLGNWVKQTTTTAGAGDLTLAAVTGFPTANAVFGGRRLFYTVLNADGLPLEAGEGYLSSAAVLVRDLVLNTFDGSALSGANAPFDLPAGTKQVMCAPIAQSAGFPGAVVDTTGFALGTTYPCFAGNFISDGEFSGSVMQANVNYLVPFFKDTSGFVSQMGVRVTTAAAGKQVACALFDRTAKGFAGRTVCAVDGISTAATGEIFVSLPAPVFLPAGWYWSGIVSDGTPSISGATIVQHAGGNMLAGRRARFWTRANVYAPYGADAMTNSTGGVAHVNNLPTFMVLYK